MSRIQVENRQKLAKQILFNKSNLIPEVRLFVNKNNYYVLIASLEMALQSENSEDNQLKVVQIHFIV